MMKIFYIAGLFFFLLIYIHYLFFPGNFSDVVKNFILFCFEEIEEIILLMRISICFNIMSVNKCINNTKELDMSFVWLPADQ